MFGGELGKHREGRRGHETGKERQGKEMTLYGAGLGNSKNQCRTPSWAAAGKGKGVLIHQLPLPLVRAAPRGCDDHQPWGSQAASANQSTPQAKNRKCWQLEAQRVKAEETHIACCRGNQNHHLPGHKQPLREKACVFLEKSRWALWSLPSTPPDP